MKLMLVSLAALVISTFAYCDGKIPQDAVHFTEIISGDVIPATEGDEAGFTALKKAKISLEGRCTKWKAGQKALAGKNFLWAECSSEVKAVPIFATGYDEITYGKGQKAIGWIAYAQGVVVFEAPAGRLKSISVPSVTSEVTLYQLLEPASLKLDAIKRATEQYQKTCDAWRTTIRDEMGDNFVYASCDGVKGELQEGKRAGIRILDNHTTRSLRITGKPQHSKVYYVVDLEEE